LDLVERRGFVEPTVQDREGLAIARVDGLEEQARDRDREVAGAPEVGDGCVERGEPLPILASRQLDEMTVQVRGHRHRPIVLHASGQLARLLQELFALGQVALHRQPRAVQREHARCGRALEPSCVPQRAEQTQLCGLWLGQGQDHGEARVQPAQLLAQRVGHGRAGLLSGDRQAQASVENREAPAHPGLGQRPIGTCEREPTDRRGFARSRLAKQSVHRLGGDATHDQWIVGLDHGFGIQLRRLFEFVPEQRHVGGPLDRRQPTAARATLDQRTREVPAGPLEVEHAQHLATGREVHLGQLRVGERVLGERTIGVVGQARRADPRAQRRQPPGDHRVCPSNVAGRRAIDDEVPHQLVSEAQAGLAGLAHEPTSLEQRDRAGDALAIPARDPLKPWLVDMATRERSEQRQPPLVEAGRVDALAEHPLGTRACDLALAQRPRLGLVAHQHFTLDPRLQGRPSHQRNSAAGLVQRLGQLLRMRDRAWQPGHDHALELGDGQRLELDAAQQQLRITLRVPVAVVGHLGQARWRLPAQPGDDHRVMAALLEQQATQHRDRSPVCELQVVEQDHQRPRLRTDRSDTLGDRDSVTSKAFLELDRRWLGRDRCHGGGRRRFNKACPTASTCLTAT
jgi:hypothetical protein